MNESKQDCATVENTLIKIDIAAQRKRAIVCSDLLDVIANEGRG